MIPGLFDGAYCVTADALAHGNPAVLIPGTWTFPDRDVNPQQVEFNIVVPPEGVDVGLPLQNFGWDYQFLPMAGEEKTGNTNQGANCLTGPGPFFPVQWWLPEFTQFLIEGRDYDSEWLLGLPEGLSVKCWLSAEYAQLPFPIEELEVLWEPELLDGSISGWAYIDKNGNSVRDAPDGAIYGARLTLKSGLCPGLGSGTLVETDRTGYYIFSPVTPGNYCVLRDMLQQTMFPDYHNVTVLSGQAVANVNFRR